MRGRQVNVRLSEEEYRLMRFWAYQTEVSLSDLARQAVIELITRFQSDQVARATQPELELR